MKILAFLYIIINTNKWPDDKNNIGASDRVVYSIGLSRRKTDPQAVEKLLNKPLTMWKLPININHWLYNENEQRYKLWKDKENTGKANKL